MGAGLADRTRELSTLPIWVAPMAGGPAAEIIGRLAAGVPR